MGSALPRRAHWGLTDPAATAILSPMGRTTGRRQSGKAAPMTPASCGCMVAILAAAIELGTMSGSGVDPSVTAWVMIATVALGAVWLIALSILRPTRPAPTVLHGRQHIPTEIRQIVFNRDGGRCVECGATFDIQYDHIIPVARGGATTVENLQILCATCNRRKSDRI
jgi:hypothetical protein